MRFIAHILRNLVSAHPVWTPGEVLALKLVLLVVVLLLGWYAVEHRIPERDYAVAGRSINGIRAPNRSSYSVSFQSLL